jgi:cytochrome c biogenesis protein CcmG, thiol:disulfide interchange protein DsbE
VPGTPAETVPGPGTGDDVDDTDASADGPDDPGDGAGPPTAPAPDASAPPPRPRKLRALLIGCVIAVALGVFLFVGLGTSGGSGSDASGPVVGIGTEAPGFSIPSLTGGAKVNLDAVGRDRHHPVVLNFFASWCGPCQKETPMLARTAAAQQGQGSTVRFVGVDVNDKPVDALPFVRSAGITYPVGVDPTFDVSSGKYALYGLPQTFFIDAQGKVVGHVQGPITQGQLDQWLHKLGGSSA